MFRRVIILAEKRRLIDCALRNKMMLLYQTNKTGFATSNRKREKTAHHVTGNMFGSIEMVKFDIPH
jgi:hypothetical protein